MRLFRTLGLVIALACPAIAQETALPPPPPLDAATVSRIMQNAVDGFIRPGYARFAEAATALSGRMDTLCLRPSETTLQDARSAFDVAAAQWARIEIVRVGPALEANRFERILYYPDRKGVGLRQVQALLAGEEPSALEPGALAGKSVGVQGLGALEFVLFGAGAEALASPPTAYRCLYGAAVAGNVAGVAGQLQDAWAAPNGIAASWTRPGPQNPQFRTPQEAATGLLGLLVHGAEAMRDQRIEGFYKGPGRTPFPRQALFWRSGNTFAMIAGNLDGLRALFDASELGGLLGKDQLGTVDSIHFLLTNMTRVAGAANPDIEALLGEPAGRGQMDYLLVSGKDLILRFNDELGGAIGLSAGFSFQDGD